MYFLYHLNKMSELLVHGLLSVSCGEWQVACVDKVLQCRSLFSWSFCVFVDDEGPSSYCPCAFPALWLGFGGS